MNKREAKDYIRRLIRELGLELDKRAKLKYLQEAICDGEKAGQELSVNLIMAKQKLPNTLNKRNSEITKISKRIYDIIDEIE